MSKTYWIITIVVIASLSFAGGRFLTEPTVITKNVEVIKEVEVIKRDVRTVIREITRPDGTKETDTVIEDRTRERTRTDANTRTETVVTNEKPQWKVDLMARAKITNIVPVYGASIQRRIIGPVFMGVNGWSDANVGLSVGLEF